MIKRIIQYVMGIVTTLSLIATNCLPAFAYGSTSEVYVNDFMKIVHLDCGRKYFSLENLEALIDTAAQSGLTHVQLAIGNDGLRFLLNDMTLEANGKTYTTQNFTGRRRIYK